MDSGQASQKDMQKTPCGALPKFLLAAGVGSRNNATDLVGLDRKALIARHTILKLLQNAMRRRLKGATKKWRNGCLKSVASKWLLRFAT